MINYIIYKSKSAQGMGKHFKFATKNAVKTMVIMAKYELSENTVIIQNLDTREKTVKKF